MKFVVAHKLPLKHQFLSTAFFFSVAGLALAGAPLQVATQSANIAMQQDECPAAAKGESTSFPMDDVMCGRVGTDKNQQSSVVVDEVYFRTDQTTKPHTVAADFIVSDDLVE